MSLDPTVWEDNTRHQMGATLACLAKKYVELSASASQFVTAHIVGRLEPDEAVLYRTYLVKPAPASGGELASSEGVNGLAETDKEIPITRASAQRRLQECLT